MARIVTMGEIMLRLSPSGNDRFIQSDAFRVIPGGGAERILLSEVSARALKVFTGKKAVKLRYKFFVIKSRHIVTF